MRATAWKISTFAAMGVAGFLALHPLAPHVEEKGPAGAAAKAKAHSSGWFGWLGGSPSASDTVASHTGTHLQELRNARNAGEQCEALRKLALEATGDEEAIGEIADRANDTHPRNVRVCAVSALEKIRTGAARSYLGDLVADSDTYVRDAALRALASRAADDPDARSTMIAAAHSEDRETRLEALVALGDAHVPEASALIQDAILHETGDTRSRLINALGETHDATAVASITKMLDDGSTNTREAALEALGSIGGEAAVTALQDKLKNGSREDATAAAMALARTGDASAKQTLIDATQTGRRDEHLAALRALAQLDGPDVRSAMVRDLHTSDPQVVSLATQWFSAHGDRAAVSELASLLKTAPPSSHGSIVSVLSSLGGDEARDAIAALARTGGPDQISALNNLSGMPGGKDEARRIAMRIAKDGGQNAYNALSVLGQDGSAESRDALVSLAKAGGDVAPQAMGALAQHGDPDAMRALSDLARSAKTPQLRGQALSALASSNNPANTPVLLSAAHDKEPAVRRAALAGLARLGGENAERALVDATSDADTGTRMTAIRTLGSIHTSSATAQLEKLAGSTDANAARTAFSTLVTTAPDRAAVLADRAMSSGTVEMRQTVVQNASQLSPEASRRIYTAALRDADASVADSAINGLANIGGADAQQSLLDVLSSDAPQAVKRSAADALDRSATDLVKSHAGLVDKYKSPAEDTEGDKGESGDEDLD